MTYTQSGRVVVEVLRHGAPEGYTYWAHQPVFLGQGVTVPLNGVSLFGKVIRHGSLIEPKGEIEVYHDVPEKAPVTSSFDLEEHIKWLNATSTEMMVRALERADLATMLKAKLEGKTNGNDQ